ncbi:leucine-rich repeat domain-containing protein [Fulvitalea axinellae]
MRDLFVIFLSMLSACSFLKKEEPVSRELETERKVIRQLEEKFGFINVDEKVHDYSYYLDSAGFVEYIRIIDKNLEELPQEIFQLKRLTSIGLFSENITDIPKDLDKIESLEKINLLKMPIRRVSNLKLPDKLKFINFTECPLEEFPKLYKENDSIPYDLIISDTKIDTIPDFVGEMNLSELDAEHCPLTYVSPNLGDCENITQLNFEGIKNLKLPDELRKLKKVEDLNLKWTALRKIPDFVWEMKNLDALYITSNLITEIPPEIGKLKKLKFLYAQGNYIATLPKEFAQIKGIELIHLEGNPIKTRSLPAELFFPRTTKEKPELLVNVPGRYDCFSVPEEQVRQAFDVD